MITFNYLFKLICFVWLIEPLLAATPFLARPGCNDTCGNNVTIAYPFGIGSPDCFLDEWYEVACHDHRPYLSKYYGQEFGGEVLDVAVDFRTITINAHNTILRVCEDKGIWLAGNLSGSPFMYQANSLTFVGCGNVMLFANQTDLLDGCTSNCDPNRKFSSCLGINCCEIDSIFKQQIYLNFSNLVRRNDSCSYVIFGNDINSSSLSDPSQNQLGVTTPVLLRWEFWKVENNTYCETHIISGEYYCRCPFCTEGNPFIPNGCQAQTDKSFCLPTSHSRKRLIILVGCGTSFVIAFLGTTSFLLYKLIRKRTEKQLKEKFFKRNGGILLQQQLSVDESMVDKVRFFTSTELDKATDHFNENRVLGRGGQGTVYKGMLVDGKIVAVKKSKLDDKKQVEQFINEVVLLSQINHRNVVKLLGCCLETVVPLLVYEFIPNGTLYDLMHNEDDEFILSWNMRLRIATEVGGALHYLHSATSAPIYHRDVKSSNILLDEKHRAKVSDFGISRHVTIERTHLTTMVKGTFGYLDPEYFQSNQFTDKSDVYSFGVVLVELLTRQKPIPSTLTEEESSLGLAGRFLLYMEEDRLDMILDTQILDIAIGEEVTKVAILAQRCLSLNGRKRPTMKEVAMELQSIKMSHNPAIKTNFQGERGIEAEFGNDTITSSSDADPLLSDNF